MGLLVNLVAFFGIDMALKFAFASKDEKLQKAARQLQERQGVAQTAARAKLADRERGFQRRERAGRAGSPQAFSDLIQAVAASSNVPGDVDTEAGTSMTMETLLSGRGQQDIEGMLAALASLQEKTAIPTDQLSPYGRLVGANNARA